MSITLRLQDAVKHTALPLRGVQVAIFPYATCVDPARLVFEATPNTKYLVVITPPRGMNYETRTWVHVESESVCANVQVARRRTVLYVMHDRPTDAAANAGGHHANVGGVWDAARAYDCDLEVDEVSLEALPASAEALEQRWHPFAIFGAGGFSEWFHYGNENDESDGPEDALWSKRLDSYMEMIRCMDLPMFAACSSHQLVAAAYNGFGALAHMNNHGDPIPISAEHALSPHRLLAPQPRVGEEGTYPLRITEAGFDDPVVAGALAGGPAWASHHHKDMVTIARGFTRILGADRSRPVLSRIRPQANRCCDVQGLRLQDSTRLLYSTQFHPEIRRFEDATDQSDEGFGHRLLIEFFRQAELWWKNAEHSTPKLDRRAALSDKIRQSRL